MHISKKILVARTRYPFTSIKNILNFSLSVPLAKKQWRLTRKLICFCLIFTLSFTLSGATSKTASIKIPIFGFHDIVDAANPNDKPPKRIVLENDYFKQDLYTFLNYLVKNKYWFLSTQDLFVYFIKKSKPIPPEYIGRKPVMITFDDGYEGVHKNVLPILKDLEKSYGEKVKIVWFVNPGYMGVKMDKFIPHATCDELRDGYKRGYYDIQSHGHNHKKLTLLKDSKDIEFELEKAKNELRECTQDLDRNKLVSAHIAYPFGSISKRVEKYLPKYYLTGYIYDDQLMRVNRFKNFYRISRIAVNRSTTSRDLITIANRASVVRK